MHTTIQIPAEGGSFAAYVAQPSAGTAPVVIVLHEVFGVNADMRQTCDALAEAGFVAVCPDLFWRQSPGEDLDVRSEADWQKGLALYMAFDRDRGVGDILAAVDAARRLEGASGKVGLLGYCLGGLMTFLTAARGQVDAAVAFHGADSERYLAEAPAITAPMLMHLAEADEFIPPEARAAIVAALEPLPNVEVFTYPGVHHAFSRHGGAHYDAPTAALANQRTWDFLRSELG